MVGGRARSVVQIALATKSEQVLVIKRGVLFQLGPHRRIRFTQQGFGEQQKEFGHVIEFGFQYGIELTVRRVQHSTRNCFKPSRHAHIGRVYNLGLHLLDARMHLFQNLATKFLKLDGSINSACGRKQTVRQRSSTHIYTYTYVDHRSAFRFTTKVACTRFLIKIGKITNLIGLRTEKEWTIAAMGADVHPIGAFPFRGHQHFTRLQAGIRSCPV